MADFNRVIIITELMNGRALSASWLANRLNLSPQATRFHLKKLEDVELIVHRTCGKHRYYEIKNQDTAMFIESTFKVIPPKVVYFYPMSKLMKNLKRQEHAINI
ncbi:winged helix-turn-helix domain-containing protein [Gilliamella apicola]|uniref:winged helix-turn-helix domain-containing protein n=1 Tax=Gilliamella apicola TaxID=1196095 RepID=UPI003985B147